MNPSDQLVISLFDYSTIAVQPWNAAGYHCTCYDLQHVSGHIDDDGITRINRDILQIPTLRMAAPVAFVMAFPPCTDLAVSGARWFQEKGLKRLIYALQLFDKAIDLCESSGAPYFIENPVSVISTHYRKADYIFQPWMYGDLWKKKTCLWTGGGFIMPKPIYETEPEGVDDRLHMLPPSPQRANLRSKTPPGFARAVFEANRKD